MYTAYVLSEQSRKRLENKYPPKYSEFIGHHITVEFGVSDDIPLPVPAIVKVLGIVDSGDGLEALVVAVNTSTDRACGGKFHITWSLDPEKYAPKDSNDLVQNSIRYQLSLPITIDTKPTVLK